MEKVLRGRGVEVTTLTTDDGERSGDSQEGSVAGRVYLRKKTEFYKIAPGALCWLRRHLRQYDILHVHALFSFLSVASSLEARRQGIPYVVRPLGTLARYGVTERRPMLKRLSLKWIEGPILNHAAAVHFTSETERREAEQLGIPMRSVVIPLGVEADAGGGDAELLLDEYPELDGGLVLLFLSRIDPKKNLEGLLDAFERVTRQLADTWLLVAGDGDPGYVARLKTHAASLGIEDRVRWLGYVEDDRKASAFALADLFVLPSYSENFGIAAVEAMMAGLPVILGRGVALSQAVEEAGAGKTVEPVAEEIAAAVASILPDETLRMQMGKRAQSLARDRYSMDAMGRALIGLYKKVIASQANASLREIG